MDSETETEVTKHNKDWGLWVRASAALCISKLLALVDAVLIFLMGIKEKLIPTRRTRLARGANLTIAAVLSTLFAARTRGDVPRNG